MERNQSSDSLSILPLKSQLQSLNHITPSYPHTHSLNILMFVLCSTMKPSMISAEEILILKDQPILTWTDSLLKSSHPLPLPWDSMVPWTSMSLNSKPTWSHIPEFTLCCHLMLQSSQLKKLIMNNFQLLKSLTVHSNPLTWWPNVIPDMVNIWLVPCFIEVMLSPKTSMLLLQPSKPKEPSNSSIGAQLDSKSELTINHQQSSQEEILPKLWELFVWFPTQLPLLKFSQDLITNSI